MAKSHLSGQHTHRIQIPPAHEGHSLKVSRMHISKAVLLAGAGAVAVIVPVAIMSLILFLIGA
ncbi:hypothetical protein ASG24_02635 [Methylophilus sp. Leaf414]|nr:hypothetical protein ASG24_02635 [Methylophilus sp. Leaf414]